MTFPPLPAALEKALHDRNYLSPTPVQAAILEDDIAGQDLIVSAQTGSGKTVAYGLAVARILLEDQDKLGANAAPQALIITPTRELALQVEQELLWLFKETGARIISCVGGMDPKRERQKLAAGAAIVVGTPGRIRDHIERKALQVDDLAVVVLDEADDMLDLGFREDLEFILETTPEKRRTLLFSATMPRPIIALAGRYQKNAKRLDIKGEGLAHADIEYHAIRIAPREVEHAVVNILRFHETPGAFVFCNTREHVRHLHAILAERGFAVVSLSGELGQNERNIALQALRDGRARVCVATDVAARGIDLPNLGLVIHADLPRDAETLQHRSGRTGRAGRKGIAALLIPLSRRRRAEQILNTAKVEAIWQGPPQPEEIYAKDQQRLLNDPRLMETPSDDERSAARLLLESRSAEDIAASLVRFYRSQFPAAEDVFDPGPQGNFSGPKPPKRDRDRDRDRDFERERSDYQPREAKRGGGNEDFSWFRLDIGRNQNAEPKWLLPMLCRRGKLPRGSIGKITVGDNETFFGVATSEAESFLKAASADDKDEGKITAATGPAPAAPRRVSANDRPRGSANDRPRASANDRPRERANDRPRASATDRPRERANDKPRETANYKPRERDNDKPRERSGLPRERSGPPRERSDAPRERSGPPRERAISRGERVNSPSDYDKPKFPPRKPGRDKPAGKKPAFKGKKPFKKAGKKKKSD